MVKPKIIIDIAERAFPKASEKVKTFFYINCLAFSITEFKPEILLPPACA